MTPSRPTPDASKSPVPSASVASDSCDVCLIARREGFALVPCGHVSVRVVQNWMSHLQD